MDEEKISVWTHDLCATKISIDEALEKIPLHERNVRETLYKASDDILSVVKNLLSLKKERT